MAQNAFLQELESSKMIPSGYGNASDPKGPCTQRLVLEICVLVLVVQVLGKYMIMEYLDAEGEWGDG